jgi:uncharacterized protein YqgV (UPF0045/DUF77 family)
MSITTWIDGRIKGAVDEAVDRASKDILAALDTKLGDLEANVGAMFTTISGDVDKVAGAVTEEIHDLGDIPEQVIAKLPDFGAIINNAIRQFNPFAR